MEDIYALCDYKGNFGSKSNAKPYRSGFNKNILKECFNKYSLDVNFLGFHEVSFDKEFWNNKNVIYTSSEEIGLKYKSFIEDVVLGLERINANIIPRFDFLRANNNKVYMEILRERYDEILSKTPSAKLFGTVEELLLEIEKQEINYPCVVKRADGAMSRGVLLAKSKEELIKHAKKVSSYSTIGHSVNEYVRQSRHKGYLRESAHQQKFIVQPFVPNLKNDWKVLVYGDHYYILNRGIRANDFRASGSHYNYKAGTKSEFPLHLLNEVENIYNQLNIPHLSLDFSYDGVNWFIHEFQAVFFGTSTIDYCDALYKKENDKWVPQSIDFSQEEEYVWGIVKFFEKQKRIHQ